MSYQTKEDIIKELVDSGDYLEEDIKGKTRKELLQLQDIDNVDINDVIEDDTEEKVNEDKDEVVPLIGSLEWHDYVMSKFGSKEIINGNPKTDALRRVARLLFGEISYASPQIIQPPFKENDDRATVVVSLSIDGNNYSGAADVCWRNTEKEFAKHPVATAETRAEGRALKRALLISVHAAEEIVDETKIEYENAISQEGKINDSQIEFFNILGERADINIEKFIEKYMKEKSKTYKGLRDITYEDACDLTRVLGELKIKVSKEGESIDSEIVGFEKNWQDKMGERK